MLNYKFGNVEGGSVNSITIKLPLPPKELSPNARCHWGKKAKAVKQYRKLASFEAFIESSNLKQRWKDARSYVTAYFKDKRRRDRDNLLASLKSAFDGIVDAGVLDDDSGLIHMPIDMCVDKHDPRVEITIEKV